MYAPAYNQVGDRAELLAFLQAHNFAILVTGLAGRLVASHLPAMVADEDGELVIDMHMARANPQWGEFLDEEVLVIFSGPHAYISPRWYEEAERVPTWNYAAVHAYGVPEKVDDALAKHASQRRLVAAMDPQWLPKFDSLGLGYLRSMLEGIVNFRIPVTRLETRWKLSQNRGRREMERIAGELDKLGESALAALTRKHIGN